MATLITGGTGYVGSHTVAALHTAGRDVVVLDDFSNSRRDVIARVRSLTTPDLIVVEGDAGDRPTIERLCDEHDVDSVVHFAACPW
ncbi:NAD-dependent epimerase/dehydratase family protein [Candidatus Poriferisodalis sp.]|uniref:NAD-dependent epimerase/dehydratase family protein n=1 Tax=Candidatus Poriferisodalis sp. TaxID=3101277 RepID=UPI003B013533